MDPVDEAARYDARREAEYRAHRRELREQLEDQFNNDLLMIFASDIHDALDIPMDQLCLVDENGISATALDEMLKLSAAQMQKVMRTVIDERMVCRDR